MGSVTLAFVLCLVAYVIITEGCDRNTGRRRVAYRASRDKNVSYKCGWWKTCYKNEKEYYTAYKYEACRVNAGWGGWRAWSRYGACNKPCGTGKQTRTRSRSCNNPTRKNGGSYCIGGPSETQSRICNTNECPVNGGWSGWRAWSSYSACTKSCGTGKQTKTRTRSCNNPTRKNGGRDCSGDSSETYSRICNTKECPVDGKWSKYSKWSSWGECSETCGVGVQKKTRTRTCIGPKYDGEPCIGDTTEERTKECKLKDCPGFCECQTVGESNYKTFDGEWIKFFGTCRYLLAKSVDESSCPFSVEVTNHHASQTSDLPYKREIDISVQGTKIRLLKDKKVLVNNRKTQLPFESSDKSIEIFISGRYIRLETNCGLDAEFDGDKHFELVVKDTFAKRMKGLCGNCDKEKNDLKTKDGTDMTNGTATFSKIADSWAMTEEALEDDLTCSDATEVFEVSDDISTIASSDEYCGYLQIKENNTNPFSKCLESKEITSSAHHFDMCAEAVSMFHDKNTQHLETAVCNHLAAFVTECVEKDVSVTWRRAELCPLSCGADQTYSNQVSGCQENCVNHNSKKTCDLPLTEGCACQKGYVLGGSACVKKEECGCNSKVGYIAPGEEILSVDCATTYKCVSSNGTVSVQEDQADNCHKDAFCHVNDDGDSGCKCKDGYQGDGVKECKRVIDCREDAFGENYSGKRQYTVSGKTCQAWAETKPHKHRFGRLADQGNNCRNPDGHHGPWCYTVEPKKRWELCYVPMCEVKECRIKKQGLDYNGHKSTTKSGYTCQSWADQSPHKHGFKGMDEAKNYCRNPDNEPQPWCYTTNPKKRWEFCDIPMCEVKECIESYDKKGENYSGNKNTTKTGFACKDWSESRFKKLSTEKNYCRNPDGEPRPWCYTTNPKKKWEFCDIPACKAAGETEMS